MNSTKELRKWARQFRHIWIDPHSGDLTYIIERFASRLRLREDA